MLQLKIIFLSFSKNINKYYYISLLSNFDVKKIPISCSTNIRSKTSTYNIIKVLLSKAAKYIISTLFIAVNIVVIAFKKKKVVEENCLPH